MNITPDIIARVGWVIGGIGLVLLLFELKGDRALGRRRCGRCWYDLRDTQQLDGEWQCPECGKQMHRERQLRKTRRRWKLVAVAAVLISSPVGLHAGRVVQDHGWASLLPDWVLVRMPIDFKYGVAWGSWDHEMLLLYRPDKKDLAGVIHERMRLMGDHNRRHLLDRVQRHVNSGAFKPPSPKLSVNAYDVHDLVEPSDWFLNWTPRVEPGGCTVPGRVLATVEQRSDARRSLAHSLQRLLEDFANFDEREPSVDFQTMEGLLLVAADETGHARTCRIIELMRSPRDRVDVGGGQMLGRFDATCLALYSDPYGDWGYKVNALAEKVLIWTTDHESWADLGPGRAISEVCGDSLTVIGPEDLLDDVETVLQWLASPSDGAQLPASALRTTNASAVMLDLSDLIDTLRIKDENTTGFANEDLMDAIVDYVHYTDFFHRLWDSAADFPAFVVLDTYLIVSCDDDYELQIRFELDRLRSGESTLFE